MRRKYSWEEEEWYAINTKEKEKNERGTSTEGKREYTGVSGEED